LMKIPGVVDWMQLPRESLIYMDHQCVYDSSNTLTALEGSDIRCPDIREYLPTIANYVRQNLRFKRKAMY
jgi:hypothetical protein